MQIAIIGTGNIGGTLAKKLADAGHTIYLGVRTLENFKGKDLVNYSDNITVHPTQTAVQQAQVVIIAVPAAAAGTVAASLGDVTNKVVIDTMNMVGPKNHPYQSLTELIANSCNSKHVVKCFNCTGYENLLNPIYQNTAIDMFAASDSAEGIATATQLAKDIGFGTVHNFGGMDKTGLLEQFALCWINLAIFQKQGRDLAFKVVRR